MKSLKSISGLALLVFALVACNKEELVQNGDSDTRKINLTITTASELCNIDENMSGQTKTTITPDSENPMKFIPSWLGNEKMGIWVDNLPASGEAQPDFLTNTVEGQTATFTGELSLSAGQHTIYGYASSADKYVAKYFAYGVGFDIPQVQHPTLSAFDSDADLLIAKPQVLDIQEAQTSATIENVQFARPVAVVKVVLKDASSKGLKGNAIVKSLTLTPSGSDYLTGRLALDVANGGSFVQLNKLSAINVKAEYTDDSFVINDENAAWLIVNPITLSSSLTLTVDAGKYTVTKTLDAVGTELKRGDVTIFNVSLTDEDVTVEESGLALPFEDNFYGVSGTSPITNLEKFDVSESVYANNGSIRLGTSSKQGTITTKSALDLSEPFTVIVFGTGWADDEHGFVISAGNQTETMSFTTDKSSNTGYDECLYAYFDAETVLTKISFSNKSGERVLLKSIRIVSGEWVPSPELTSVETVKAVANETSAVLSGSYDALFIGESDVLKYGFEWGVADGSDMASVEASNAEEGDFSCEIDNLVSGTTYVFRAWAQINSNEKVYGDLLTFTASEPVGIEPSFDITSYNAIPEGWEGEIGFGSYFKMAAGNYLTSPMFNMEGYTSARISIDIASFGQVKQQSAVINISYDGGKTYTESYELPAPTSKTYKTQTYDIKGPFTAAVVINLTPNDNCTPSNCVRIQNYNLSATK